jgi:pimeloyl-ACP methyl ester carboxylesterase
VLSDTEGLLALPTGGQPRCAVLVLSGSSGRIEIARTRLLARHGAAALSPRWFGGPGQPPGICEVALETFAPALDRLASLSDHLCVIGTSMGAEAALLLASRDQRIRAVAGLSPSAVVWANVGPGLEQTPAHGRSSWSTDGHPLPFVPSDPAWVPTTINGLPSYRGLYEQSLRTFAEHVPAATIPVERITAEILLAAGGDDQVWPSDWFA